MTAGRFARTCLLFVATLAASAVAPAQDAPPEVPDGAAIPDRIVNRAKLGRRVAMVEQRIPIVDQVVLVPDGATYLDELRRWSLTKRWPVLFEDDRYAPMFIRRFRPERVVRRASVGQRPREREDQQRELVDVVVRAWGGNPVQEDLAATFAARRFAPPGVVITSVDDAAWTAAVALAAGRGQPIAWLDGDFLNAGAIRPEPEARELQSEVGDRVESQGYPFAGDGDVIETITVCRTLPGRFRWPRTDTGRPENAAMTDILGRAADGERWAITGWIFGDEVRCAYVAMCSLFLTRSRIWACHTYEDKGGWTAYDPRHAQVPLEAAGFTMDVHSGDDATLQAWLREAGRGLDADIVLVNSRGPARKFGMFGDAFAFGPDVPVLNMPAVVHMVHSWSMQLPDEDGTVAGEWLDRGAYAYVGSMQEPFLSAFVPPRLLAVQWVNLVPFLCSARHWEAPAPLNGPWRVNLYGDPLMLCAPPAQGRDRIAPGPLERGEDLQAVARELLRAAQAEPSPRSYGEAVRALVVLGRDDLAIQAWELARGKSLAGDASAWVLPALFRAQQLDDFTDAFDETLRRRPEHLDMLWHLYTWRLDGLSDEDVLLLLQSSPRRPDVHVDLMRLVPALARVFGAGHARNVVQRELERNQPAHVAEALRELLRAIR